LLVLCQQRTVLKLWVVHWLWLEFQPSAWFLGSKPGATAGVTLAASSIDPRVEITLNRDELIVEAIWELSHGVNFKSDALNR
jgi:hypothetical protein